MATITIDKRALKRIQKKLGNVASMGARAIPPMQETVKLLFDDLTKQPTKAGGAFTRMATPGQRRAYWAKVSSGEIRHSETSGYIRSGTLKRMWGKDVQRVSNGVKGKVENLSPYGIYVQRQSNQQPFHKASKWLTEVKAMQDNRREITRIWTDWVRKELRD